MRQALFRGFKDPFVEFFGRSVLFDSHSRPLTRPAPVLHKAVMRVERRLRSNGKALGRALLWVNGFKLNADFIKFLKAGRQRYEFPCARNRQIKIDVT